MLPDMTCTHPIAHPGHANEFDIASSRLCYDELIYIKLKIVCRKIIQDMFILNKSKKNRNVALMKTLD